MCFKFLIAGPWVRQGSLWTPVLSENTEFQGTWSFKTPAKVTQNIYIVIVGWIGSWVYTCLCKMPKFDSFNAVLCGIIWREEQNWGWGLWALSDFALTPSESRGEILEHSIYFLSQPWLWMLMWSLFVAMVVVFKSYFFEAY